MPPIENAPNCQISGVIRFLKSKGVKQLASSSDLVEYEYRFASSQRQASRSKLKNRSFPIQPAFCTQ